ncbi:hypothetical protein C4J81_03010 [Deltaproteobacteria bacterium Smac51]|nr:hypothetical protein C4J81_03010 [Deltaproteobacteria bacterium Smac51]
MNNPLPGYDALKTRGLKKAMTLVELMVVILIGLLIIILMIVTYTTASRQYVRQDNLVEQMQNLRVAIYSVTRDARMAGSGFRILGGGTVYQLQMADEASGQWFKHEDRNDTGVFPIYGRNSVGPNNSDTLTICWLGAEFATPIGTLNDDFTGGGRLELVDSVIDEDEILRPGDKIIIVNDKDEALALTFTGWNGGSRKDLNVRTGISSGGLPEGLELPAESLVYNVRDIRLVTYQLNNNKELIANLHGGDLGDATVEAGDDGNVVGGVVVAANIEDFQVRYLAAQSSLNLDNAPDTISGFVSTFDQGLANWPIGGLYIGLTSISSVKDPTNANYRPVDLFDNKDTNRAPDGYARRTLTEVVKLRNMP